MNFKISDIEVGDKILVKQLKLKKLTLYKSQPFTVTEKKGIIGKIRLWERILLGAIFLLGGWNLRRSGFDHLNLFRS